jgi:hypothetical protein
MIFNILIRKSGMPTMFGAFLIILLMSGSMFLIGHIVQETSNWAVNCASYIDGLPNDKRLIDGINQACHDWLGTDMINKRELREFLRQANIEYNMDNTEFSGNYDHFYAVRYPNRIVINIPTELCMSGICTDVSGLKNIAYHEMGHIILWAAGENGEENHHNIMREHGFME